MTTTPRPTPAERARKSRAALRKRTIELRGEAFDLLARVMERDGDASLVAAATRAILQAWKVGGRV